MTVALGYFAYKFIKIHRTLRVTPAMADGVTDRLLEVADKVGVWKSSEEGGKSGVSGRIDKLMRTLSSWPALIIAAVYFGLIIGLLIVASQKLDAEGNLYTWLYLTTPWIWVVGGIPLVGTYLAIILNAATVYAIFALGIGFCQKGFRYLK